MPVKCSSRTRSSRLKCVHCSINTVFEAYTFKEALDMYLYYTTSSIVSDVIGIYLNIITLVKYMCPLTACTGLFISWFTKI